MVDDSIVSPTFCCLRFSELVDRGGEAGFSIVVVDREDGGYGFCLQSRSVAHQDESLVASVFSERCRDLLPGRIRLVSSVFVQHCPFCGTLLSQISRTKSEPLAMWASRHAGLWLPLE